MKAGFWYILLALPACLLFSAASAGQNDTAGFKLAALPELFDPQAIYLDQARIYIVEKHKIYIYSSDDFRLLKKFGKAGDEPGAFHLRTGGSSKLLLDVLSDDILISSDERASRFSKSGEFKSVIAEFPQVDYLAAFGRNYVASAYVIEVGTGKSVQHVVLFDKDMEFLKEIAESHLGGGSAKGFGGPDRKMHIDLVGFCFLFRINNDKIYVANTYKGFFIEVFDSTGAKLYQIDRDYEKIKISEKYKAERTKKIEELSTYKRYREFVAVDEAEYLPAFRTFYVSGGNIYVFTHTPADENQEVLVLDLEGNLKTKAYLPHSEYCDIRDGRYFYLRTNDYDEWELHAVDLVRNEVEGANEHASD